MKDRTDPPPPADDSAPKRRSGNSSFARCDLSGASLSDCDLEGTKINGILVSDLLKAHEKAANK